MPTTTTWVFCITCSSSVTNGDFNDGAFWWNASQAQNNPLDPATGPRFVPQFNPGDQVYWATQVDPNGTGNPTVQDLRASIGRKQGGATISSPFVNGNFSVQSAGPPISAISDLSVTSGTNPPDGPWKAIGPFTVIKDGGNPNKTSRYAFVLTVTLNNQAQFGEDPEMDVQNGEQVT